LGWWPPRRGYCAAPADSTPWPAPCGHGGSLVVIGRTEQDAVDIATLIDTAASPKVTGALDFAAYLVAASTTGLDAAVRAANGDATTAATRHWVAGVWCKRETRAGDRG
jgi:hypothetical protein